MDLTSEERAMLDLERDWWQGDAPKAAAIRDRVRVSPSTYYRRLDALIDRPEALASDPLVVRRLRRARTERRRTRYAGPQRKRSQP